jgi:hypothetical protein
MKAARCANLLVLATMKMRRMWRAKVALNGRWPAHVLTCTVWPSCPVQSHSCDCLDLHCHVLSAWQWSALAVLHCTALHCTCTACSGSATSLMTRQGPPALEAGQGQGATRAMCLITQTAPLQGKKPSPVQPENAVWHISSSHPLMSSLRAGVSPFCTS